MTRDKLASTGMYSPYTESQYEIFYTKLLVYGTPTTIVIIWIEGQVINISNLALLLISIYSVEHHWQLCAPYRDSNFCTAISI